MDSVSKLHKIRPVGYVFPASISGLSDFCHLLVYESGSSGLYGKCRMHMSMTLRKSSVDMTALMLVKLHA